MEDDDSLKHELLAIGRISTAKAKSESMLDEVPIQLEPIPSRVLEELTRKFQTAPQKAYILQLFEDSGRADVEENLRFMESLYGDISAVEMTSIQKEAMWDKFLLSIFSTYVGKAIELLALDEKRIGEGPKAALEFQNKSKEIIEGFIQPIVTEWRAYHPLATTADTAVFFTTMITGLTPTDASKLFVVEKQRARERAEMIMNGLRTGKSEEEVESINDNYDLLFELDKPASIISELSISHILFEAFREKRRLTDVVAPVKQGIATSTPVVRIKKMGEKLVRMKGVPAPKETQEVIVREPEKAIDVLAKGAYDKTKRTTIVSDSDTFAKVVEGELEKDLEKALKKLEELALGEPIIEKKKTDEKE
ncbi:MAG: hypothetical protein WED04_05055 [Promethearchaeati archaeon SRVP18_Atabeyarchaeia-1]